MYERKDDQKNKRNFSEITVILRSNTKSKQMNIIHPNLVQICFKMKEKKNE